MNQPASGIQQLFVRNSSGLVKEFRPIDVFVFNVLGYGLGLVLAVTPTFLGNLYPGAGIYLVLTVGMLLSVCNGLTYGLFAAAMPRSGGDYVFIGRTLRPWIGFASNWGFTWSQFLGLGAFAGWCVTQALAPSLTTFGYTAGFPSLIEMGKSLGSPLRIIGIGGVLLATVLVFSILGMRILKRFFHVVFFVAVIGTLIMMYVLYTTDHATFVSRFDQFMLHNANLQNAYNTVLMRAQEQGLALGKPTDLWSAILALPIGYWVFIGFTYSVYIGGEVREPQKSQVIGILGALLFGYVIYMLVMGRYYAVVGRDFNNAVAMLAGTPKDLLPAGSSMVFFAGVCTKSVLLNLLMSISNFIWFYMLLFIIAQISIRNLFAWSFDRLMPAWLTKLTPGRGTPWVASLVVVGLGGIFLVLNAFGLLGVINYISMYSVCFLVCGIAAIVFPYRRRKFFDNAPPLVRKRVAGIPLISIAGTINVLLFIIVLYSALTNPGVSGVSGYIPTIILVAVYVLGIAVYFSVPAISRWTDKSGQSRVSPDLLYEELPPE